MSEEVIAPTSRTVVAPDILHVASQQKSRSKVQALIEESTTIFYSEPARTLVVAREALLLAESIGEPALIGQALLATARGLVQQADYTTAVELLHRAKELLEDRDELNYCEALRTLGSCYVNIGDFAKANAYLQEAIVRAEANGFVGLLPKVYNTSGILYIRLGDYAKAIDYLEKCLKLIEQEPDPLLESTVLTNIGVIYHRLNEYERSNEYLHRALDITRDRADYRHTASTLDVLSDNLFNLGKRDEAYAAIAEVIELTSRNRFLDLEAMAYQKLANFAMAEGQYREAIDSYTNAYTAITQTGNQIVEQMIATSIGKCYLELGELVTAERWLITALELGERHQSPNRLMDSHTVLSTLYEHSENLPKAHFHLKKAVEYREILFGEANQHALRQHNLREGLRKELHEKEQSEKRAKELEEANEALRRVSAQRTEILRIVSHDMRNPLGAIIGLAHEIDEADVPVEQRKIDPEVREMAVMIEESGKRLLSLVEQLLIVSQMQSERVELEPAPTDVRAMVELVLRLVRPVVAHKKIALTLELPESLPLVSLDEAKMSHALGNLLSNAIKFTPRGGQVTVRVGFSEEEHTLQFVVEDTGIGIPAEHLDRLFERTHDIRRPGTNREQGTGLGLSIVKHFVELHHGEMTIESSEGNGTRVEIRLPVD